MYSVGHSLEFVDVHLILFPLNLYQPRRYLFAKNLFSNLDIISDNLFPFLSFLFYSITLHYIPFYSILFYSILFYSILFFCYY